MMMCDDDNDVCAWCSCFDKYVCVSRFQCFRSPGDLGMVIYALIPWLVFQHFIFHEVCKQMVSLFRRGIDLHATYTSLLMNF